MISFLEVKWLSRAKKSVTVTEHPSQNLTITSRPRLPHVSKPHHVIFLEHQLVVVTAADFLKLMLDWIVETDIGTE